MYSSVWCKKVSSSMDIWRWSMDDLHGRLLLTIFLDDFTVYWRLHWLSVVLLSMYTIPSWVIIGPNCSVSSGRLFGRTRVGLIFLLPYHDERRFWGVFDVESDGVVCFAACLKWKMKERGRFWSEKEIFRDFRLGKQTQIYDLSLFT